MDSVSIIIKIAGDQNSKTLYDCVEDIRYVPTFPLDRNALPIFLFEMLY